MRKKDRHTEIYAPKQTMKHVANMHSSRCRKCKWRLFGGVFLTDKSEAGSDEKTEVFIKNIDVWLREQDRQYFYDSSHHYDHSKTKHVVTSRQNVLYQKKVQTIKLLLCHITDDARRFRGIIELWV